MQVFQSLAGYSLGKADMVRRAMSKKKMKELEKERVNFIYGNEKLGIDGAIKRGVPEAVAASLFDEIMDFANYAFNKAHAVCYAVVSFRTAYLKCHYPREYLAALLTSVLDVSDKISEYIQAARDMGIAVLPPDVNESYDEFSVAGENIRFGLEIKKTPKAEADANVEEMLDIVGLTKFRNYNPSQLSISMLQRVAIARAFATKPELLLMDEPYGQLDIDLRFKLEDELIKLWKKTGTTVLFITHNIEEAVYLSQKIMVLTNKPTSVKTVLDNPLPLPRDVVSPEFVELRNKVTDLIKWW